MLCWCDSRYFLIYQNFGLLKLPFTGTRNGEYEVAVSRLPRPAEKSILSEVSIMNGKYVMGGEGILLGYKDTPYHVSRGGYDKKLRWIKQRAVVLWDEEGKRGWLLNGASALLHLVRASIVNSCIEDFDSGCLFEWSKLQDAPSNLTDNSKTATWVLQNKSNRSLMIYNDDDGPVTFENRVEHFLSTLEQLFDYQAHAAGPDGSAYRAKQIPRAHLEGWDFNDLATEKDPFRPRMATLASKGKGWVDFTRSILAINLLGRGFGEILVPPEAPCPYWSSLPKDQFYLAVESAFLKKIVESTGDLCVRPVRVSDNLVWQTSRSAFEPCRCVSTTSDYATHDENMVQVILPVGLSNSTENCGDEFEFAAKGAVVFGYNAALPWRWGDFGDPEKDHTGGTGKDHRSPDRPNFVAQMSNGAESSVLGMERIQYTHGGLRARSYSQFKQDLLRADDYTVSIVCALPLELLAVRTLFNPTYPNLELPDDFNCYALGRIGRHKVVGVCLPCGEVGTNSAAGVVANLKRSFPRVKFCLMVGIGGGVPSEKNDIRLGDIVVGTPTSRAPAVIQYDMGHALENGVFEQHGSLQNPPESLLNALSTLKSDPHPPASPLQNDIDDIGSSRREYRYPGQEKDRLFRRDYSHVYQNSACDRCSDVHLVNRASRLNNHPAMHYGLIASGNRVMRDAQLRDQWSRERNVLCFEMEAAGVLKILPCLVIRGICDYADSHKNKEFQGYAAATAAAYAKFLLIHTRG